jgi:nucleoside-diphosphate-sugar epimerase
MIIGSGLLAQAFAPFYSAAPSVCVYCAGVSNSGCRDDQEFERERLRLRESLRTAAAADVFVYFGTCSVDDPESAGTPYVQHKLRMERLVTEHPNYLVVRLPQVAGQTPNPHTLLNFLYARVARSEAFQVWGGASRNIIDVSDVAAIVTRLIADPGVLRRTFNIANESAYPVLDVVRTMERVVGKRAICQVIDRGTSYSIDTSAVRPFVEASGVRFHADYLGQVIQKYYGS